MGVNRPKGWAMRTPGCNLALRLLGAEVTDDDIRTGLRHVVGHNRFAVSGVRRPMAVALDRRPFQAAVSTPARRAASPVICA